MLGKRKKPPTTVLIAQKITETIGTGARMVYNPDLSVKVISIACIIIFSLSIMFGLYGIVSRQMEISEKENHIKELRIELKTLVKDIASKKEFKEKLINDPLTMEAVARSYGMSKKGEKVFYFLD